MWSISYFGLLSILPVAYCLLQVVGGQMWSICLYVMTLWTMGLYGSMVYGGVVSTFIYNKDIHAF